MKISEVRKNLGISNSWIASKLSFKTTKSYNNSSAKKRYERLIIEICKRYEEKYKKGAFSRQTLIVS